MHSLTHDASWAAGARRAADACAMRRAAAAAASAMPAGAARPRPARAQQQCHDRAAAAPARQALQVHVMGLSVPQNHGPNLGVPTQGISSPQ
jgi:hypothetical protein